MDKALRKNLLAKCGSLALSVSLGAVIAAGTLVASPGAGVVHAKPAHRGVVSADPTNKPATPHSKQGPDDTDYRKLALPDLTVKLGIIPLPVMQPRTPHLTPYI